MQRRLFVLPLLGMVALGSGCTLDKNSRDPNEPSRQLHDQSEFSRGMGMAPPYSFIFDEQNQWFNDSPPNPTPEVVHRNTVP
jgi:hypothetical protein